MSIPQQPHPAFETCVRCKLCRMYVESDSCVRPGFWPCLSSFQKPRKPPRCATSLSFASETSSGSTFFICGRWSKRNGVGQITRDSSKQFWVSGYDNESNGVILHPRCRFDYCVSQTVIFPLNDTDLQCSTGQASCVELARKVIVWYWAHLDASSAQTAILLFLFFLQ